MERDSEGLGRKECWGHWCGKLCNKLVHAFSLNDFLHNQGSSALQIVPALQPRVKRLYNYVRGKTWLSPPFASDKMDELTKGKAHSENCELIITSIAVALNSNRN